jgi:hypothetical protein
MATGQQLATCIESRLRSRSELGGKKEKIKKAKRVTWKSDLANGDRGGVSRLEKAVK